MKGRPMTRLTTETKTLAAMIRLFCRKEHGKKVSGCGSCAALQAYALARVESCRYGNAKPTCKNCATHCYSQDNRTQIRIVMRIAGPRMIVFHPWLALRHLFHGVRRRNS